MRALSRAIDKFCARHRRFGVPKLMRYIVFMSAAVYIIHMMDRTGTLLPLLGFHPGLIMSGQVWRLVTWVFLPLNSNVFFTAIMLYFYYYIGSTLEREWGTPKFTIYYISGLILNIIYGLLTWFILKQSPSAMFLDYLWFDTFWLAPNFLNLSMFFAFAALFPDHRVMLFFIIPIKMKWMALISAAFFVYSILADVFTGKYAIAFLPLVALLNFLIICGSDLLDNARPIRVRSSPQTINFRKAAEKARREYDDKHYRHKCSVCSKTDTDYPDLEFRYCSRCSDYHCFCIDHINNHIHFK